MDEIHTDIENLLVIRFVFRGVRSIIQANPRLDQPSSFYSWMGATYVTAAAVGCRRHATIRNDSVSFARLLQEISLAPSVLSRERHVSKYAAASQPISVADREFDSLAGTGQPHLDSSRVTADLEKLTVVARPIKRYTDTALAHLDEGGPESIPTFNDLDACLDLLEALLKKYLLIIKAQGWDPILPVWQYDWTAIFREPWIPQSPPRPAGR